MTDISVKQLMEAGVHFGHQSRRWNPKMKKYIFGNRNNISIIDLQQTVVHFKTAMKFVRELGGKGGSILFVATKAQAKSIIIEQATRCGMPYICERWLGGMLTNFETIRKSVGRLKDLDKMADEGTFEVLSNKESIKLQKERIKLERNLGGIKNMEKLPDAVFILDTKKERIALAETKKLGLPVVAVVDSNCDPVGIEYIIPGNDDAARSITLMASSVADAIMAGAEEHAMKQRAILEENEKAAAQAEAAKAELEKKEAEAAAASETAAPTAGKDDKGKS